MSKLVLHKPELRQADLFGRKVEALMVETASLAEASYYWCEASDGLIPNFYVKEGRFYISLTDVSCRFLDKAYDRFTGNESPASRTFIKSCHFFETMRETYLAKGGNS